MDYWQTGIRANRLKGERAYNQWDIATSIKEVDRTRSKGATLLTWVILADFSHIHICKNGFPFCGLPPSSGVMMLWNLILHYNRMLVCKFEFFWCNGSWEDISHKKTCKNGFPYCRVTWTSGTMTLKTWCCTMSGNF
jgi:hypothetical protein